jgi:hypothetical protein
VTSGASIEQHFPFHKAQISKIGKGTENNGIGGAMALEKRVIRFCGLWTDRCLAAAGVGFCSYPPALLGPFGNA